MSRARNFIYKVTCSMVENVLGKLTTKLTTIRCFWSGHYCGYLRFKTSRTFACTEYSYLFSFKRAFLAVKTSVKYHWNEFFCIGEFCLPLHKNSVNLFRERSAKTIFQQFEVGWLSPKLTAILARPKQPCDVITLMPC